MRTSPENQYHSGERKIAPAPLEKETLVDHKEALQQAPESLEDKHEKTDEARREALEKAQSIENIHKKAERVEQAERPKGRVIGQKERDISFNSTMKEVRTSMSPSSRAFSQFIHNKTVEKVSETVGASVARPNAILSGAIVAFALTLALYLIAKNLGYVLSGFETIGTFVLGWAIGLTYDFLKVMVTGRK